MKKIQQVLSSIAREAHKRKSVPFFSSRCRNKYEKLKPGLVASYALRPESKVGLFLQPGSPHGVVGPATHKVAGSSPALRISSNNLRQVVRTHVPLSPSSIIWYRSRGADALRLGR